jgi:hypothetical protein
MENDRRLDLLLWRVIFTLAAAYNLAFGAWAMFWPNAFFDLFNLAPPVYPGIWSCLGMVIGVYGLGYAYVAWKPGGGDVIALLGLIGKVLGPVGWLIAVSQGDLPARTFPLIVFNDLMWWYPFLAYLLRREPRRREILALIVVLFHLIASIMLLVVRGGTELEMDFAARALFIQKWHAAWTVCWFLWVAASLGLMAFFVLWGLRLIELNAPMLIVHACWAIALAGLACDLSSEIILVTRLTATATATDSEECYAWGRRATLLGAGFGNGLYCVAGVGMSFLSRQVLFQSGVLFITGMAVWTVAAALTIAAFLDVPMGLTVAGAALMALFIPWATLTSLRFHRDSVEKSKDQ